MTDAEFILGLLENKAAELSALAYAYDCCEPEECAEGAAKAELLRAQDKALSDFANTIRTLVTRTAETGQAPVVANDERSVLILDIMGQKIATIHRSGDWKAAIDEFEAEHPALVENGYARAELMPIQIPTMTAAKGSEVTIADARFVFIEDVSNELAASIHNTLEDLRGEVEKFKRDYADMIGRDVVWDVHVIAVPPPGVSNLLDHRPERPDLTWLHSAIS